MQVKGITFVSKLPIHEIAERECAHYCVLSFAKNKSYSGLLLKTEVQACHKKSVESILALN